MTGRMELARLSELAVAERLRSLGWHVEPIGQGQMDDATRRELQRIPHCPWRWMPDMLAIRDGVAVVVDAKGTSSRNAGSKNHAVEYDALQSALTLWAVATKHLFVWDIDWTCATPVLVNHCAEEYGVHNQTFGGSGTPYVLVPKAMCRQVDDVLGRESEWVAA